MKKLTIKEIQKSSLEVLKKIDEICRQQGFQYYLAYGTLLGAVRHKGFIPWDDDIDIMMPRKDYEMFIRYFVGHKNELTPFKIFEYRYDVDYPYMIARVSDNRYKLNVYNEKDYGIGLFVDIYPLDGAGDTKSKPYVLKKKSTPYASMCFLSTRKSVKRENTKSLVKYILKFPVFIFAKMLGKNYLMKKLEKIGSTYSYDDSKYVGVIVWASDEGTKTIYPKTWFGEGTDLEFEGLRCRVPIDYDKVLTRGFGNYMELPPEKDRVPHHYYDAYIK